MTVFLSDADRTLDWQEAWKFWLTTYWSSWQCAWVFQITAAIETPLCDCTAFLFPWISKTLIFNGVFYFFGLFCSFLHLAETAALLLYPCLVKSTTTQTAIITDNRHHKRVCHMPCQLAKLMTQLFYSSLCSS